MIDLLLIVTLRRRAAGATRKLAERLRVEADWLQLISGAIAGCGCTSRFDWCCIACTASAHCPCDCHERCSHCSADVNARRRRTS